MKTTNAQCTFAAAALIVVFAAGCGGGSAAPTPPAPPPTTTPPPPPAPEPPPPPSTPEPETPADTDDPFAEWNELEEKPWFRPSKPYSCATPANPASLWTAAGLIDLGGADPLSLIRYFGNGSYLRYGHMGFYGCTPLTKYPESWRLDPPVDPAYYSRGDIDIWVDIARVPKDAEGWQEDDGQRIEMSMAEAVRLLNTHVAAWYRRISAGQFRITFQSGNEFTVAGDGSPSESENQQNRLVGACLDGCDHGAPGGLNRVLLNDVAQATGGQAFNGSAYFGLVSLRDADMELIVHELGHGWMDWAHSFAEVPWKAGEEDEITAANPYSNFFDVMSQLDLLRASGWDVNMPGTLAINRYSAGWIRPEDVALHTQADDSYTLSQPRQPGHQFLVIHSGRRYAFTTIEVLDSWPETYRIKRADVYDPDAPNRRRARRYDGVLVSRYDQTGGTGAQTRLGPALYHKDNPEYLTDVGWGRDDYALISDGESRAIGSGVTVSAHHNQDGT